MDVETAAEKFKTLLKEQPDISPAILALTVLYEFLEKDTSKTVQGLHANIRPVVDAFMRVESVVSSVKSASEMFLRFITLASLDQPDFKEVLCKRGKQYLENVSKARMKIAKQVVSFINENYKILTHGFSRVVLDSLIETHKARKNFHVYVTESTPDCSGRLMHEKLQKAGIDSTLIIDAAVGHIVERIDIAILGADTVVENGGIINNIGSYTLAHMTRLFNKNVYVLAESFKFAQISPVNQRDLAAELLLMDFDIGPPEKSKYDYTPPNLITLIFTDVGKMTTSAVFDLMNRLYM